MTVSPCRPCRILDVTAPSALSAPGAGERTPPETLHYPVSEVAAKYGASVAKETYDPDDAYADWPGEYLPMRLPWPLDSDAKP